MYDYFEYSFDFVFINIIIHINVINFIIYIIFMSQSLVVVQIGWHVL